MLVYVTIDTPHVEDQAHSSYASGVFSKIMGDILPYLNVFPSVDFEAQQSEASTQLPEAEGITDNTGVVPETEAEPKVYETEEYVEPGADSDLPEDVPESSADAGSGESDGSGYVTPVQNVPESSASEESTESSSAKSSSESSAAENSGNTESGQEQAGSSESTQSSAAGTAESSAGQERETMSATSAAGT